MMQQFNWLGFNWIECRQVRLALWDYASERLSEDTLERVERHLQRCAGCRRECDTLRHAQGFLNVCRAEEEPAPRTGWAELRMRLENETPQAANAMPNYSIPADSPRFSFNGDATDWERRVARAFLPMQLMTAMAGSFALIAIFAVGYGMTHLQPATGVQNDISRATQNEPGRSVATQVAQKASNDISNDTSVQTGTNLMNNVAQLLAVASSAVAHSPQSEETVATTEPLHPVIAVNSKHIRTQTANAIAFAESTHNSHGRRTGKIFASSLARQSRAESRIQFRPYTPKPEERLADTTQVASRLVLEHVRPASDVVHDGDEASIAIVGTVQPAPIDDRHEY